MPHVRSCVYTFSNKLLRMMGRPNQVTEVHTVQKRPTPRAAAAPYKVILHVPCVSKRCRGVIAYAIPMGNACQQRSMSTGDTFVFSTHYHSLI